MAAETFVSRATSSSGSPRNTRHYGHLALNGKTLRPICIDARGGAFAGFGRALQRPFGLAHVINRHFKTSGCGAIYRSRMSQLSVPHPKLWLSGNSGGRAEEETRATYPSSCAFARRL